jgi:hypothetical protein
MRCFAPDAARARRAALSIDLIRGWHDDLPPFSRFRNVGLLQQFGLPRKRDLADMTLDGLNPFDLDKIYPPLTQIVAIRNVALK